jgi:hypothetical protein
VVQVAREHDDQRRGREQVARQGALTRLVRVVEGRGREAGLEGDDSAGDVERRHREPRRGAQEEADDDLAPGQRREPGGLVRRGRHPGGGRGRREHAEQEPQQEPLAGQHVALAEARHDHQRGPQPGEDEQRLEQLAHEVVGEHRGRPPPPQPGPTPPPMRAIWP